MIDYHSSRGKAPVLPFGDVLLTGLANDGGLYLPSAWPPLPGAPADTYAELAAQVMQPFVEGSIAADDFAGMVADAYATFDHPDVCPLVRLDEHHHLLELFHGPTLAFKDVALQLVGRLFDHELERRQERVMIVGATSGDTGSAAMEAVRHSDHVDIVILFPEGRTSEVQRRQMTTIGEPNVHAVAIEGTFDDCQDLVKAMFADEAFRSRNRLSAVNSINWARVMAQIVYYVWAAQRLGRRDTPTTFCVPTGNFGNVFAGHVAAAMGLPVERFLVASNRNDILTRLIDTGEMVADDVVPTLSPSMDIQISSNLERLLVELFDGNGAATAELLNAFREYGRASLTAAQHERLRAEFAGARLDDDETLAVIAQVHRDHGLLIDPHTAVGIGAAERLRRDGETVVTLATAHPAKFPDAVEAATGVRPELPPRLAPILERDEAFAVLPNDLAVVQDFVDGARR
ncbi:MAG: threonine synthase [Acidimicrobiales bacterium]|nr:threonine synthase [Acidimicrobiales bacterium]